MDASGVDCPKCTRYSNELTRQSHLTVFLEEALNPKTQQMTSRTHSFASSRRVSFEGDDSFKRRCVGLTSQGRAAASMVRKKLNSSESTPLSILKKNEPQQHVMVLHGRVIKNQKDEPQPSQLHWDELYSPLEGSKGGSIRNSFERKHKFSQLAEETKQFQQQVSSLEQYIKEQQPDIASSLSSSTSSDIENGWRIRVLIKTAQESEKALWTKLFEYEKTLLVNQEPSHFSPAPQNDLREAQTACMKLHRDFKRSHKSLMMCVSLAEGNDPVDVTSPPIDSVGWTGIAKTEMDANRVVHPPNPPVVPPPVPRSHRSSVPEYTSFRPLSKNDFRRTPYSSKKQNNNTDTDRLNEEDPENLGPFRECLSPLEKEDEGCCHSRIHLERNKPWTMCGAFNFNNPDDDVSSLASSSKTNLYEQWYKTLQHELHSMQLDLLHVRSNMIPTGWVKCNDSTSGSDNSPLMDDDDDDDDILVPPKAKNTKKP